MTFFRAPYFFKLIDSTKLMKNPILVQFINVMLGMSNLRSKKQNILWLKENIHFASLSISINVKFIFFIVVSVLEIFTVLTITGNHKIGHSPFNSNHPHPKCPAKNASHSIFFDDYLTTWVCGGYGDLLKLLTHWPHYVGRYTIALRGTLWQKMTRTYVSIRSAMGRCGPLDLMYFSSQPNWTPNRSQKTIEWGLRFVLLFNSPLNRYRHSDGSDPDSFKYNYSPE